MSLQFSEETKSSGGGTELIPCQEVALRLSQKDEDKPTMQKTESSDNRHMSSKKGYIVPRKQVSLQFNL